MEGDNVVWASHTNTTEKSKRYDGRVPDVVTDIQPFVDGNKRTSRLSGNAILQSFDSCPLSYRSMDEVEYKKAILLFYEQNNISYFKELFLKQFEFAMENYFG